MNKAIETLERMRVPLIIAVALGLVSWLVVGAFGPQLGVDGEFRAEFLAGVDRMWKAALALLTPLLAREFKRDTDNDGTPDWRDDDANGNGTPDGQTEPPAAMPHGPTLPLGKLGDAL